MGHLPRTVQDRRQREEGMDSRVGDAATGKEINIPPEVEEVFGEFRT